ncbi:MAG TPA: hypothetical protein DCR14_03045 [Acidimicrobiaceae bacterium]|nr:hypothetical protein [Acidimicrobiaceae bacterium]
MSDNTWGAPGPNLQPPQPPVPPPTAAQPTVPMPQYQPPQGQPPQGPPPQGPYQPPMGPYGTPGTPGGAPPAKKKTGLIVGGALAAVAAVTVGVIAVSGGDDKGTEPAPSTTLAVSSTVAEATTTTPTTEPVDTTPVPADVDTIARSVVQISATLSDGSSLWWGSGTIVSPDGLILTNAHVVENYGDPVFFDTLVVSLTERADALPVPTYIADVVAFEPEVDLAVIQIFTDIDGNPVSDLNLPALPIGDSDQIRLGDELRILGFPSIGGDTITFTQGSVSGFSAQAGYGDRAWVKSDATISGGNSGGTAVNEAGELVAVPTNLDTGDGRFADCRVLEDTNGDGVVDGNDTCIPLGGFINGLRPVNLALQLIEEGRNGVVVDTRPSNGGGPVEIDVDTVGLGPITFSTGVADDGISPIDQVEIVPAANGRVCAFFDWEGMVDGVLWDAAWYVNGEFNETLSLINQEWFGGPSGESWWACAGSGEAPLVEGEYEVILYVAGEAITSESVFVGNYGFVDVSIVNSTSAEVCYLQLSPSTTQKWGSDDFGAEQTLLPGDSTVLTEVGTVYDVRASDCDFNIVSEQYGLDLTAGGTITLV